MTVDFMPAFRAELLADMAIATMTANRIAVDEAEPGWADPDTKATGPRKYRPFIVLVELGPLRSRRIPVVEHLIAARCYGQTRRQARELRGLVSDAIHDAGPRVTAAGVAIYVSADEGGGDGVELDPDTEQPVAIATLSYLGSTLPVEPVE